MQITVYTNKHRPLWSRFLDASANGTLFHSQEFLDYHPAGRFAWHHLIFGNPGEPLAVMPGAIQLDATGKPTYRSPSGATLGGLVVRPRLSLSQTIELVQSLVAYGRESGWSSAILGTVPPLYWRTPDDALEFVLRDAGFFSTPQLMFYVPLKQAGAASDPLQLIPSAKRWEFRKSLQQGLEIRPAETPKQIAEFYEVLKINKAAHGTQPVHSLEEMLALKARFPERIRILCAIKDGQTVAGIYRVAATPRVSYTQYIADRPDSRDLQATRFVLFHTLQELVQIGVEFLDLGPSVQLPIVRRGGVVFKESVGGFGCERREWILVLSQP
jgi:hypothetical protein